MGSGRHQVPLIKKAESIGFRTIVADNVLNSPGRKHCSIQTFVSSTDYLECKKLAIKHNVVGILTAGTDQPVSVMAKISEDLALPCYISSYGALIATSKLKQRKTFENTEILQPRFKAIDSLIKPVDDWDSFPCIVKPDCSQGQRGITFVKSRNELIGAISEALMQSKNRAVILESYIQGPEFTVNAWMNQGEISFLAVSDRITYSHGCMGVCFQHIFPSLAAKNFQDKLKKIVKIIADTFEMSNGPLYIQMIASSLGPVLVEAAARIGGGHESLLFPHMYNFDPNEALLKLIMGRKTKNQSLEINDCKVGLINFIFANPGKCLIVKNMNYRDHKNIFGGQFYIQAGDNLSGMKDGQGRIGFFLASGENRDEIETSATMFYSHLSVQDDAGKNLIFMPSNSYLLRP